jgi:hypothetical protein
MTNAHLSVLACTFVLNTRHILTSFSNVQNSATIAHAQLDSAEKRSLAVAAKQRDFMGPFVSACLTFGLDESIDETVCDAFHVNAAQTACGLCR